MVPSLVTYFDYQTSLVYDLTFDETTERYSAYEYSNGRLERITYSPGIILKHEEP